MVDSIIYIKEMVKGKCRQFKRTITKYTPHTNSNNTIINTKNKQTKHNKHKNIKMK